jgi:hypothetical protein
MNQKMIKPNMESLWRAVSTTSTMALFLVVGITGLMLLFKVSPGIIKAAHEWLGALFVLAAGLHTFRHWTIVCKYFRDRLMWTTSAVVLLLLAAFALPMGRQDRRPRPENILVAISAAPLEKIALLMGTPPDVLVAKLKAEGVQVNNHQENLQQIAKRSGRRLPELVQLAMSKSEAIEHE